MTIGVEWKIGDEVQAPTAKMMLRYGQWLHQTKGALCRGFGCLTYIAPINKSSDELTYSWEPNTL